MSESAEPQLWGKSQGDGLTASWEPRVGAELPGPVWVPAATSLGPPSPGQLVGTARRAGRPGPGSRWWRGSSVPSRLLDGTRLHTRVFPKDELALKAQKPMRDCRDPRRG